MRGSIDAWKDYTHNVEDRGTTAHVVPTRLFQPGAHVVPSSISDGLTVSVVQAARVRPRSAGSPVLFASFQRVGLVF